MIAARRSDPTHRVSQECAHHSQWSRCRRCDTSHIIYLYVDTSRVVVACSHFIARSQNRALTLSHWSRCRGSHSCCAHTLRWERCISRVTQSCCAHAIVLRSLTHTGRGIPSAASRPGWSGRATRRPRRARAVKHTRRGAFRAAAAAAANPPRGGPRAGQQGGGAHVRRTRARRRAWSRREPTRKNVRREIGETGEERLACTAPSTSSCRT